MDVGILFKFWDIYIYIPVNPLPGVETNDDWVVWLTVVLVKLISEN